MGNLALSGRRLQVGVTLIEACCTIGIAASLAAAGTASWQGAAAHRELEARAVELETDLQWLRTEAVMRNSSLRLSVQQADDGACYVIHTGADRACTCDAAGSAQCEGDAQALKSVGFPSGQRVSLSSNVRGILLDPRLGTASPGGTVAVSLEGGRSVRHVVSLLGRVRGCSVGSKLGRYPTCGS